MSDKRSMQARARYLKTAIFWTFFNLFFLQLGHAIFQSIGKWGQEIRFQCQTRHSSTLTDALVTSRSFQIILSYDISKHT